jgi:hypothetical protein
MLPFVAVHLVLFFSMPWPIALASVLLAIVISFPLAYLFELGGDTIWAPALLHFVIQATVKVVVFSEGAESFAIVWIAAFISSWDCHGKESPYGSAWRLTGSRPAWRAVRTWMRAATARPLTSACIS